MIAIGHPSVSLTIRLARWGSSGPSTDDLNSSRASSSGRPPTRMSGMPSSSTRPSAASRVPNTSAIRSAYTLRPTMASTSRDSWSSHCASSTTHSSGESAAASASSESAARPTPKRSAGLPSIRPKAEPSASRWRCGNPAIAGRNETSSLCSPRNQAPAPTRRRRRGSPGTAPPSRRRRPEATSCQRPAHPAPPGRRSTHGERRPAPDPGPAAHPGDPGAPPAKATPCATRDTRPRGSADSTAADLRRGQRLTKPARSKPGRRRDYEVLRIRRKAGGERLDSRARGRTPATDQESETS